MVYTRTEDSFRSNLARALTLNLGQVADNTQKFDFFLFYLKPPMKLVGSGSGTLFSMAIVDALQVKISLLKWTV